MFYRFDRLSVLSQRLAHSFRRFGFRCFEINLGGGLGQHHLRKMAVDYFELGLALERAALRKNLPCLADERAPLSSHVARAAPPFRPRLITYRNASVAKAIAKTWRRRGSNIW